MTPRQFVHLHTHSEYSEFDGLSTVKRIAAAAAADGNPAVAITDHGTIASTWALRSECEHFGIKPIPGIEAYMIVRGTRESPEKIHVAADAVDTDAGDGDEGATGRATKTKTYEHLTILARTAEGFRNLILLANISQETKWGGHPLMDYELLAEHGEGLIVLTGCLGGPVAGPLSRITGENDEHDEAEMSRAQENVDKLISAVGRENVYVEVADHGIPAQESALPRLYDFAEKNGLRIVAANDSHYVKKQEQPAHEGWIALGLSKQRKGKAITVSSEDRYRFSGHGHHFRTAEEMHAVRPDDERWQEACDETVRIAERIEDDLYPPTRLRVPRFPIPAAFTKRIERGLKEGEDGATLAYFKRRIQVGAKYRFGTSSPVIRERLSHESEVVRNLGMMDYFLIVADIIEWARSDWTIQDWIDRHDGVREIAEDDPDRERKEPILVGPGRGSAAGSLISYCLLIVNADPLENGLLFERFLDPERTEMPDIDVDFEKLRRPEVIEYISARYGRENVCYLGMHGTNKTKSALDSAGRYLEISTNVVTEIKKLLHDDTPTISAMMRQSSEPESPGEDASESEKKAYEAAQEAYEKGVDIRHHLAENPHLRTFFLYASVYESVVTNPGKHACGFVISDEPLLPLIPMWINKDGERVSEWDGGDVADFGLLKMDILGLRTLDVARAAEDNARANYGDIPFDFMEPNLGGAEADRAWGMLGEGRSVGVFQLESGGMRDLLTTAHPSNLDDLSALIAAFRPGPMSAGMHTDWAERTGGKKKVSYDNLTTDPAEQEVIASVLGETSGVILFQEQMMRLGKVVGNFTAAQANQLRRAISKKKQSMLDELKPVFISGAQTEGVGENGEVVPAISRETAERLWVAFEGSGAYAFNKSHTTAYGLVAYQTAYLKANWPAEFGAATLRFTETSKDKAPRRIAAMNSLRDEKIEIMAPDVNMSEAATVARDGKVWIGLGEVKGVGDIAHTIIAEREENGPYTSMADLAARARRSTTDDSGRKRTKGVNYSQLCSLAQAGAFDAWGPRLGHMVSARAVMKNPSVPIPDFEWSIVERAARQRDVLRTTIDGHPTTVLHDQIQRIDGDGQTDATPRGLQELHALPDAAHRNVDTYGIVSSISRRFTRKGSKMMTMDLESERAIVKTVGFSRTVESLESSGTMPAEGDLVRIKGKVEIREYEKETTDEETGETATEKVVERSIILDSVEPLLVEDEPREQEKHVGFVDLLLGSSGDDESESQDDDGDPGDDSGPGDDPDDGPDSDPDDPEPSDDGVVPEWADDWDAEPEPAPEPAADPAPAESPEDSPDVASKPSEVLAAAEAAYEDDPDDDDDDAEDDEPVDKRTMLNKNLETAEETDAWRALLVEIEKSFPESGPAGFGKLARFPEAGDPEAKDWETTPVALSSGDLPLRFGTRTLAVVDLSDRRTPFSAGGMGRMNRGQVIVVVDPMEAVSQIESVTAAIRSGAWTPGDLDQRGPIPIGE